MIEFCTEQFGNEGWLQMFSTRQLRREQEDQQYEKEYAPKVDAIRNGLVDPFTMKLEKIDSQASPTAKWDHLSLKSQVQIKELQNAGNAVQKLKKSSYESPDVTKYHRKSTWLDVLEKEREERKIRAATEKRARANRLAALFDLGDDVEDVMDLKSAEHGILNFMERIDTHLRVEKKILEAWKDQDDASQQQSGLVIRPCQIQFNED